MGATLSTPLSNFTKVPVGCQAQTRYRSVPVASLVPFSITERHDPQGVILQLISVVTILTGDNKHGMGQAQASLLCFDLVASEVVGNLKPGFVECSIHCLQR